MTEKFDRGSAILLEYTFKQKAPHASLDFADITSAFVEVTFVDSPATVVNTSTVSATNANSTGLYHSTIQTSEGWALGAYQTKVTAFDSAGVYSDVDVEPYIFELE